MASIEAAYSLELEREVDPELAYDLFWAGQIEDKSNFACPDKSCRAKAIAINIDKLRHKMKQSPHFRVLGSHSTCCEVAKGLYGTSRSEKRAKELAGSAPLKDPALPDVFKLQRPLGQLGRKSPPLDKKSLGKKPTNPRRGVSGDKSREGGYSSYYSVGPLIARFIRYREEGLVDQQLVKVGSEEYSYKDLFRGVYRQQMEGLPQERRIYWGLTFVSRFKSDNGYTIRFSEYLKVDEEQIRPTIPITDQKLADYPIRKPLESVLREKASAQSPGDRRCFVFVYGAPVMRESHGRHYINFDFDTLDHIETRDITFFEQLKRLPEHAS